MREHKFTQRVPTEGAYLVGAKEQRQLARVGCVHAGAQGKKHRERGQVSDTRYEEKRGDRGERGEKGERGGRERRRKAKRSTARPYNDAPPYFMASAIHESHSSKLSRDDTS